MTAYHQMGHDTRNLVPEVTGYGGAILSPVNCSEGEARDFVETHQGPAFETILDPQLYFPGSDRGFLPEWPYFPKDVETADQASDEWWDEILKSVVQCARRLEVRRVCSPISVPRSYTPDYYESVNLRAERLHLLAKRHRIAVLKTLLWPMDELTSLPRVMETASILSGGDVRSTFLVLVSNVPPGQEYRDSDSMRATLRLVRELHGAGLEVIQGYAGPEAFLLAHAGAAGAATGKFMNLRRFTPGRFEEPAGGGGAVAFWYEEAILTRVPAPDLVRLRQIGILSESSQRNPFGLEILKSLEETPRKPWVGLGWRQYMHWFAELDSRIRSGDATAEGLLKVADANWKELDRKQFLMTDRNNDGSWVRPWLRAVREFEGAW